MKIKLSVILMSFFIAQSAQAKGCNLSIAVKHALAYIEEMSNLANYNIRPLQMNQHGATLVDVNDLQPMRGSDTNKQFYEFMFYGKASPAEENRSFNVIGRVYVGTTDCKGGMTGADEIEDL